MGVSSAWADMTVGTTSSDYGTAISGFVTMSKGQSIRYVFSQTTAGSAFFHGFAVAVNSTADAQLAAIRCDNWENIENTNTRFTNTFPEGWGSNGAEYYQTNYMNGASVDMTITYSNEGVFTMASTITKNENDYTYNWSRSFDGTPAQVKVSLVADHAQLVITDFPVPTISVPSTFDFSAAGTHSASPFDNGMWVEGTNVKTWKFSADGSSVTGTAYFDSNLSTDGNQAYSIASNEKVTMTINAFHSWLSSDKTATVSILNSADVVIASYSYDPHHGNNIGSIKDVKIGGATVEGFTAFDFRSMNNATQGANGWASGSKPYVSAADNHPVITISVSGTGSVKLLFTRALTGASIEKEFTGTLAGSVAKDLAKIEVTDGIENADRAYCIQKLTLATEEIAGEASVTYKYEDMDGTDLSSLKADIIKTESVGATVEDLVTSAMTTTFYNGDESTKYVYNTFACSDATVPAGGTTVTLKFDAKAKYNYTVKGVDGESSLGTVSSGFGYAGEEITYYYPEYALSGTTLYKRNNNGSNPYFGSNGTLDANNKEFEVTYGNGTVENVVFYTEAEDIAGFTAKTTNNATIRCSMGKGGNVASATKFTTLPTGKYKINGQVWGNTGLTVTVTAGGDEVWSKATTGALAHAEGSEFTLLEETDLYVTSNGDDNKMLDLLYIVRTGDATISATLDNAGYATLASAYPLNVASASMTASDGSATAYKAAIDGTVAKFTELDQTIPANTGILLKGTANATVTIPVVASGTAVTENAFLVNTTGATFDADADYYYFAMKKNAATLTFNAFAPGTLAFPANKAYLKVLKTNFTTPAPSLTFDFGEGETTGINAVKGAEFKVNGEYYNLAGQRVAQPKKGLYIVNGRKVVIK